MDEFRFYFWSNCQSREPTVHTWNIIVERKKRFLYVSVFILDSLRHLQLWFPTFMGCDPLKWSSVCLHIQSIHELWALTLPSKLSISALPEFYYFKRKNKSKERKKKSEKMNINVCRRAMVCFVFLLSCLLIILQSLRFIIGVLISKLGTLVLYCVFSSLLLNLVPIKCQSDYKATYQDTQTYVELQTILHQNYLPNDQLNSSEINQNAAGLL